VTSDLHLRFETRASKPPVFRITEELIAAAKSRSEIADIRVSLGEDLRDLSWLGDATASSRRTTSSATRASRSPNSPDKRRFCAGSTSLAPGSSRCCRSIGCKAASC
jgi:hypothetical protein